MNQVALSFPSYSLPHAPASGCIRALFFVTNNREYICVCLLQTAAGQTLTDIGQRWAMLERLEVVRGTAMAMLNAYHNHCDSMYTDMRRRCVSLLTVTGESAPSSSRRSTQEDGRL
eukprot:jgi/Chrzof1/5945/Cz16g21150.t1